jgi:hypothetical protein
MIVLNIFLKSPYSSYSINFSYVDSVVVICRCYRLAGELCGYLRMVPGLSLECVSSRQAAARAIDVHLSEDCD